MGKRPRSFSGSEMTDKQVAQAVLHGRMVTAVLRSGQRVSGYLCGADRDRWAVVTPGAEHLLIHKHSTEVLEVAREGTYDDEPRREELDALVAPYRRFLIAITRGTADSTQAAPPS